MPQIKRALIIGCGKIAGGYNNGPNDPMVLTHAAAYNRAPNYEFVACVDPDETKRAKFMVKWRVPHCYATLDQALDAEEFDIASVCSPTGTHLATLTRLLHSNVKAIYAEKPLDGNPAAARDIAALFDEKNVPVAVNFTRRFDRSMQELKQKIAADRFGSLRSVTGWYGRGVVNNGSHVIDLVNFLTATPCSVVRVESAIDDGVRGDPTVSALLELGGVSFRLVGQDGRDGARFEVELVFAKAVITIEEAGLSVRVRHYIPSSGFVDDIVLDRGYWYPTQYGSAMLSALDELSRWPSMRRLSSDIESASHAIVTADNIRSRAMEKDV